MIDEWILSVYSTYNDHKGWQVSITAIVKFYNVRNRAHNMRLYHFLYEKKEYNIFLFKME